MLDVACHLTIAFLTNQIRMTVVEVPPVHRRAVGPTGACSDQAESSDARLSPTSHAGVVVPPGVQNESMSSEADPQTALRRLVGRDDAGFRSGQLDAAERGGVRAATINSDHKDAGTRCSAGDAHVSGTR